MKSLNDTLASLEAVMNEPGLVPEAKEALKGAIGQTKRAKQMQDSYEADVALVKATVCFIGCIAEAIFAPSKPRPVHISTR